MELSRIEQYARELGAILHEIQQAQQEHDQFGGLGEITDSLGDVKQGVAVNQQREARKAVLAKLVPVACTKTGKSDVDGCFLHMLDLQLRLAKAAEARHHWREAVAEFEYKVVTYVVSAKDRRVLEAELLTKKGEFERRVTLAADMMPNTAILIRP